MRKSREGHHSLYISRWASESDFGFNAEKGKDGKYYAVDVVEGGAAWRAGIRNGVQLKRWGLHPVELKNVESTEGTESWAKGTVNELNETACKQVVSIRVSFHRKELSSMLWTGRPMEIAKLVKKTKDEWDKSTCDLETVESQLAEKVYTIDCKFFNYLRNGQAPPKHDTREKQEELESLALHWSKKVSTHEGELREHLENHVVNNAQNRSVSDYEHAQRVCVLIEECRNELMQQASSPPLRAIHLGDDDAARARDSAMLHGNAPEQQHGEPRSEDQDASCVDSAQREHAYTSVRFVGYRRRCDDMEEESKDSEYDSDVGHEEDYRHQYPKRRQVDQTTTDALDDERDGREQHEDAADGSRLDVHMTAVEATVLSSMEAEPTCSSANETVESDSDADCGVSIATDEAEWHQVERDLLTLCSRTRPTWRKRLEKPVQDVVKAQNDAISKACDAATTWTEGTKMIQDVIELLPTTPTTLPSALSITLSPDDEKQLQSDLLLSKSNPPRKDHAKAATRVISVLESTISSSIKTQKSRIEGARAQYEDLIAKGNTCTQLFDLFQSTLENAQEESKASSCAVADLKTAYEACGKDVMRQVLAMKTMHADGYNATIDAFERFLENNNTEHQKLRAARNECEVRLLQLQRDMNMAAARVSFFAALTTLIMAIHRCIRESIDEVTERVKVWKALNLTAVRTKLVPHIQNMVCAKRQLIQFHTHRIGILQNDLKLARAEWNEKLDYDLTVPVDLEKKVAGLESDIMKSKNAVRAVARSQSEMWSEANQLLPQEAIGLVQDQYRSVLDTFADDNEELLRAFIATINNLEPLEFTVTSVAKDAHAEFSTEEFCTDNASPDDDVNDESKTLRCADAGDHEAHPTRTVQTSTDSHEETHSPNQVESDDEGYGGCTIS